MSAAIGLRDDFTAADLRRLAGKVRDADQVRRLLALAAVYDGMDRSMAARIGGMDRQTLRDWVHRFNEHGPIGLINVKPAGRRPKLSVEQQEALRQLVAGDVLHGGFPVQSVEERLKKGLREVSANLPLSRKLPKSTSTPLSDIVEIPGEFFPSSSQDRVTAAGRCVAGRSSPRIGPKADLGVT